MITVNIEGVDKTTAIEYNTFNLTRAITSQVDILRFNVIRKGGVAGGGYKPSVLDDVEVLEDATQIFGGQIVEIEENVVADDIEVFTCLAKDYSYDMDRTLIAANYEDTTVADIIEDFKDNFLPAGYTTTNVNCDIVARYIAFNYEYPSKCLQQLAELVNYDWYVDGDKNIYFFEKSTYPAPFGLTDISGNYYYNTLKVKNSLANLRNSVIVRGGQYLGELTSEKQIADGTETTFKQGYQYNTVFVKLNTVSQTVGIANIDDPDDFDCVYNFQEKFVLFPEASKPADGDEVEVGGFPYIPVIVKVKDPTSVTAYGEHQFKIVDKSINSKEGARDRARAELIAWANSISDATFETMTVGLAVGQQINVASTIRGVDEDYVISRMSTTMVNGTQMTHVVTLVTTKTYGMIEFLMSLLINKDKEIEIRDGEVVDLVEAISETIVVDDGTPTVAITHNPQTETITVGESTTVQALDYAVQFVMGAQTPSGTSRVFILNGSPLA